MALLKDHLIAHYKMNDNAATAVVVDSMGNYNGTYKDKDGDLDTDTGHSTGKISGALDFDGRQVIGGTDEHIDTGDPFLSLFQNSFSISIWFKATDGKPSAPVYLFGVDAGGAGNIVYLSLISGLFLFKYQTNGESSNVSTGVLLADGQETWHHIVCTADSTINGARGLKIYFDGELLPIGAFTGDTTDAVFADFANTTNIGIGDENTLGGWNKANWYGLIDDVMFFNKTLTLLEAKYLYNSGAGVENVPSFIELSRTGQCFSSCQKN